MKTLFFILRIAAAGCVSFCLLCPPCAAEGQQNVSAITPTDLPANFEIADMGPLNIEADAHAKGVPLVHFWSKTVGSGRANEGLRATWQEQLHESVK